MVLLILVLNLFSHPVQAALQCDPKAGGAQGEKMVERINRRYDDFFRYRDSLQAREQERNKGRGENKAFLKAHDARLEQARKEYVKNRRPKPDTSALQAQAEAKFKERRAQIEEARRCYVQQRDHAQALLKKGRQIPGKLEFDLED